VSGIRQLGHVWAVQVASLEHGTPGQVNGTHYRQMDTPVELTTHPNPFRSTTTVEFTLERNAAVELSVYDIRGRMMVTFFVGEMYKGPHAITWKGVTSEVPGWLLECTFAGWRARARW